MQESLSESRPPQVQRFPLSELQREQVLPRSEPAPLLRRLVQGQERVLQQQAFLQGLQVQRRLSWLAPFLQQPS